MRGEDAHRNRYGQARGLCARSYLWCRRCCGRADRVCADRHPAAGVGDQLYVDRRRVARGHGDDEGIKRSGRAALPDCGGFADLCRGLDGGDSDLDAFCRRKKTAETNPTTEARRRTAAVGTGIRTATRGGAARVPSGEAAGGLRDMGGAGSFDWAGVSVYSAPGQSGLGSNGTVDSVLWNENRVEDSGGQAVWDLRTVYRCPTELTSPMQRPQSIFS